MNRKTSLLFLTLVVALALETEPAFCDDELNWVVPRFGEPSVTWDGGQFVEGTSVADPWSWHGKLHLGTAHGIGTDHHTSQMRGALSLGLGLPLHFEGAVVLPFGWTMSSVSTMNTGPTEPTYADVGEEGAALGDVTGVLMWSAFDATNGGFGLLFGVKGGVPTGNHERLMGEGDFSLEPFVTAAFQVLGSRLSLNLGYRLRPEHNGQLLGNRIEQDDDLIWRAGIRIPKKFDVAWSIEAEGAIGVATDEGVWPSSDSRPVFVGAGIDFPVERLYRFGAFAGLGIAGEATPIFAIGFNLQRMPVPPDEDEDGVAGGDDCPLLKEDKDGFEDNDGCPDLDNDSDGFPDDEDQCPLTPAGSFSDDGC